MGSEGEDWETDEDTHAAKGAVNHKRYSLSSFPLNLICSLPLHRMLAPLTYVRKLQSTREFIFHVFSLQRHLLINTLIVPLCHAHVPNARLLRTQKDSGYFMVQTTPLVRSEPGTNVHNVENSTHCQGTSGMRCLRLIHFLVYSSTLSPHLPPTSTSLYNHIPLYTNPQTSI